MTSDFFNPGLPKRRTLLKGLAGAGVLASYASHALAQFRVEVSGVGLTQLPIAIAQFRGEAQSPQKIGSIVRADLERSGMFRAVDAAGLVADENTRPDLANWRQKGADAMVTGRVSPLVGYRAGAGLGRPELYRGSG
jgi:TolB protein